MRNRLTVAVATTAALIIAVPAAAITDGQPDSADGDTFDAVGNLLYWVPDAVDSRFEDPGSWFSCTGTLVDDDVVLTAGHCTYGIGVDGDSPTIVDAATVLAGGTDVWVTFEADATQAWLDVVGEDGSAAYDPGENEQRYLDWSAALNGSSDWIQGTSYTHPAYVDAAFFLYDLGIVVLEKDSGIDESEYATLPTAGQYDDTQTQPRNDAVHTVVGYGIQEVVPFFQNEDVRYEAEVRLLTTRGIASTQGARTSIVFSSNSGAAARGGTCSGDSGGPIFHGPNDGVDDGGLLIGVTSYGLSTTCRGIGGGYRIDKDADLAFITTFIDGGVWEY